MNKFFKIFEPVTDTIENTSEDLTKTVMLTSNENNKELENLNNKLSEIMSDKGILAPFSISPLSKTTKLETTSQFKLLKNSISTRVSDLLIHNPKPLLYMTFCKHFVIQVKNLNWKENFWNW